MAKPSLFRIWIAAARLRTLPLSMAGIVAGNALAISHTGFSWVLFASTLLTAITFQILSNFANDYGDGVKGTDNDNRVGPKRVLQKKLISKKTLFNAIVLMGIAGLIVAMPLADLEDITVEWCQIMQQRSPLALRMLKRCMNAELDGQHGLMQLAGDATLMYYLMDEAQEGKNAFLEKRAPNFKQYPKFP